MEVEVEDVELEEEDELLELMLGDELALDDELLLKLLEELGLELVTIVDEVELVLEVDVVVEVVLVAR